MGKTQFVEKPAAGFAENKSGFHSPEDIQEIQEELKDIERKRVREGARATKVSTFLKDQFFRTDKTFTFLYHPTLRRQLSVRYFFPRKKLAVDQFPRPTPDDRKEVEFKREAFKKSGIKYFPMFPENKLMDLADYI